MANTLGRSVSKHWPQSASPAGSVATPRVVASGTSKFEPLFSDAFESSARAEIPRKVPSPDPVFAQPKSTANQSRFAPSVHAVDNSIFGKLFVGGTASQLWGDVALMNNGTTLLSDADSTLLLYSAKGVFRQLAAGACATLLGAPRAAIGLSEWAVAAGPRALWIQSEKSEGAIKVVFSILAIIATSIALPLRAALTLVNTPMKFLDFVGNGLHRLVMGENLQGYWDREAVTDFIHAHTEEERTNLDLWLNYFSNVHEEGRPELINDLLALRSANPTSFNRLRQDLADSGVEHFYRFNSLAQLRRTLSEAQPNFSDERPIAVVVGPKSDHNGGFASLGEVIGSLHEQGYRVVYQELSQDKDCVDRILAATSTKTASVLWLAGHGAQRTLQLGAGAYGSAGLDSEDEALFAQLAPALAANAQVVLDSCSTGKNPTDPTTLANVVARALPTATVMAPKNDAFGAQPSFTNDGRIKTVIFGRAPTYTASVQHGVR